MDTARTRTSLVRGHGIRKQGVVTKVPAASKSKIAEEAYTRASGFDNSYFEKMKKTTMNHGNNSAIKGIVLGKLRRNSISARQAQDSSAAVCLKLNAGLFKGSEVDLFKESVGSVVNRLSRGDSAFTDEELLNYLSKAFFKTQNETDAMVTKMKADKIAKHSLQVSVQSANLKHKPKTSTFCSLTLLEKGYINFAKCDEKNTKLTILCGTQVPLYDLSTTFPLDTANGCSLVVAVWETKGKAEIDIVNNEKRCVGISEVHLDSQPEGGSDDWYPIKSRKNDKEKGTVNIVVKFHVDMEHDADFKVQTHTKILSRFLSCDYENGGKGLNSSSAYILELHLQQKGLSAEERWLAEWTVRNALYAKTNSDYGMLLGVLNKVLLPLNEDTSQLRPHQKNDLITSFTEFIMLTLEKYRNIVAMFPYTSTDAMHNLQYLNQCIAAIVNCKAYPENTKTKELICQALTECVKVWYKSYCEDPEEGVEKEKNGKNANEYAVKSVSERIKALTTIAKTIHLEISLEAEAYPQLFTLLDIDFMSVTLHEVDNLFSVELVREISEVIKAMKEREPAEELMNSTLHLYVCVSEIKKQFLSIATEDEEFTLLQYHSWFYNPIETWLKLIRKKQVMRVCKAVELDKLEPCDDFVRYSTSVIDVETMNIELGDIYKIFDFPDESSAFSVVSKLTEQMCDSMVMLSQRLVERAQVLITTKKSIFGTDKDKTQKCKYIETLCIILNSMEQGLETYSRLPTIMNFAQFENPKNIAVLEKIIVDASKGINLQKATMLHNLCDLMQPKFDQAFKNYLKSLHSVDENALDDLYKMIVDELSSMFEWVNHKIFMTVISSLWSRVIQPRFLQQIDHRPLKQDSFYIGLQDGFINLAQFFIEEVPELKVPIMESDEFLYLCNIFKLLTNPLEDLLFRFYEEEALEQGKIKSSDLGEVHLSAHFTVPNKNDTTLQVVIKHCVDLPKMDISSLCDGIVHVLVQPVGVINFSHIKQRKTNCVKNNLHPHFNQTFNIPLHIDDINLAGACLQLTIWDKDLFSADDLIGEVLIPLRDIPTQLNKDFVCNIQHPTHHKTACYDVISHRTPYDRQANLFIKYRQHLKKSIGSSSNTETDGV